MRALAALLENAALLLVMLPLIGALLVLAVAPVGREAIRRTAETNALLTGTLALLVLVNYDPGRVDARTGRPERLQMESSLRWLGERQTALVEQPDDAGTLRQRETTIIVGPDVRLSVGIDGLSLGLIALTAVLSLAVILIGPETSVRRTDRYYALLLVLQAGLTGLFAAQDIVLFYVFLEAALLPMFFLIGLWGGGERRTAARRFLITNAVGSLLILVGLLALVIAHSWMRSGQITARPPLQFQIMPLIRQIQGMIRRDEVALQYWMAVGPAIFWLLLIGFLLKSALFPLHTWLRSALVEAPTAGGVLIAGVMLKAGGYGCLRFVLPLFPELAVGAAGVVCLLALVTLVYGALLALAQDNLHRLLAYWSISQIGLSTLGLFTLTAAGIAGGLLQLVNHGLAIAALWILVGALDRRYREREIESYGGLAHRYPRITVLFFVALLSAIGMPGGGSFVGQWLVLLSVVRLDLLSTLWCLIGLLLSAWTFLWLGQRMFFGRLREPILDRRLFADHAGLTSGSAPGTLRFPAREEPKPSDLEGRELAALLPILALQLWIGLWPQFFLDRLQPSINRIAILYERLAL